MRYGAGVSGHRYARLGGLHDLALLLLGLEDGRSDALVDVDGLQLPQDTLVPTLDLSDRRSRLGLATAFLPQPELGIVLLLRGLGESPWRDRKKKMMMTQIV